MAHYPSPIRVPAMGNALSSSARGVTERRRDGVPPRCHIAFREPRVEHHCQSNLITLRGSWGAARK